MTTANSPGPEKAVIDEPPPVLGSWSKVYTAVLCYLVLLILALYTFTRWAA